MKAYNEQIAFSNEQFRSVIIEQQQQISILSWKIAVFEQKIVVLERDIIRKDAEILRLKSQIGKNSGNSSKPPSSNCFQKIPNSREKSAKKTGGQPGHKGHSLEFPKNLDEW
jgi:hypothetical protein